MNQARTASASTAGHINYYTLSWAVQALAAVIPMAATLFVVGVPTLGFVLHAREFTLAWNELVATALVILLAAQAVRILPTPTTVVASVLSAGIGVVALVAAVIG